ncbi:hypothetical protein WDU94_013199 [Cyamophila willieti]
MVVLTNELISKWSKIPTIKSSKSADKVPKKKILMSHLYLNDRRISSIEDIAEFGSVSTIYLHNNQLTSLNNIGCLVNLTHVYLQRNKIKYISGLENLAKLQKLYLGYNEISVVEGLEHQSRLQLLHIECQNLEPGSSLYFDPRTLSTLQTCLQDLDVSHNHIGSIVDLQCLISLKHVNLSENELANLDEVCSSVHEWPNVVNIQMTGNPVCKQTNYRQRVLLACSYTLKTLDSKQVSPITKVFLQKFEEEKSKRRQSKTISVSDVFSSEVKHLVKHLPAGLCQTVSGMVFENTIRGTHHPVPITFPLNNFSEPAAKIDSKFGLRGSKPRSKLTIKSKNPMILGDSNPQSDICKSEEELLGLSNNMKTENYA